MNHTGIARVSLTTQKELPIISARSSIAQSAEQSAVNRWVPGSSPGRGAFLLIPINRIDSMLGVYLLL